jgi:hypothetical protein
VPRRVFQRLLPERPTPERCVEAYYLQRPRFESIAERKLRRRQLTEDGNVEISGRDLRQLPIADVRRTSPQTAAVDPTATLATRVRGVRYLIRQRTFGPPSTRFRQVDQAAIADNKRLGSRLAMIRDEQLRRGPERRSGPRRRDQRNARLFKVG